MEVADFERLRTLAPDPGGRKESPDDEVERNRNSWGDEAVCQTKWNPQVRRMRFRAAECVCRNKYAGNCKTKFCNQQPLHINS